MTDKPTTSSTSQPEGQTPPVKPSPSAKLSPSAKPSPSAAQALPTSADMQTPPTSDSPTHLYPEARYRHIWALAWPIVLSNITLPLVGAVDVAVMGQLPDPAYVAGVALGALLFDFFYLFVGFLRMSTTGFAARAYGEAAHNENQLILARACSIALIAATIFMVFLPVFLTAALWLLEAEPYVETLMADYVQIRIFAAPAALLNITLLGWLYGQQAMRIGMAQLLMVNLLNISLSLAFVMWLGWGIEGVAIASVGAQWGGLILTVLLIYLQRQRFHLDTLRFDRAALAALAPWLRYFSLSRDLVLRTGLLFFVEFMLISEAAKIDTLTLAAMQILIVIFGLIAYGLDGFAHAAEALVGEAIGKRRPHHLMRVARRSTALAFGVACLMSVFFALARPWLLPLFTSQPDLQDAVISIWHWVLIIPPASVLAFQMDGVFVGAAQGREMRNSMILAVILFALTLFTLRDLTNQFAPLDALLAAFIIYLIARGVLLWRRLSIVRQQAETPNG